MALLAFAGSHQIDIRGDPRIPMENDRDAADDDVTHARAVERLEDRFE